MLDKIIDSSRRVMSNSKYVKINYDVLDKVVREIDMRNIKHWLSSNPYGLLDLDVREIVNFLFYFDAIDYSFWGNPKWTISTSEGSKDGSDALMYQMIQYIKSNGECNFDSISKETFSNMLKGNTTIPLFEERYKSIFDISFVVKNNMGGDFYKYIENITCDKELFDVIVKNFPCFIDERTYNGEKVYFYKLAQLLTSDILHIRETKERIKVDYSNLVGCADYKIPQTMRALNIIEYNEELSNIVDKGIEIEVSSKYEVEIRASMLVVIDYITRSLGNVKAIDVNDYFFMASKGLKKRLKPYHLTRNTNY